MCFYGNEFNFVRISLILTYVKTFRAIDTSSCSSYFNTVIVKMNKAEVLFHTVSTGLPVSRKTDQKSFTEFFFNDSWCHARTLLLLQTKFDRIAHVILTSYEYLFVYLFHHGNFKRISYL